MMDPERLKRIKEYARRSDVRCVIALQAGEVLELLEVYEGAKIQGYQGPGMEVENNLSGTADDEG